MEYLDSIGAMAIGSRLRRLSEIVTKEASRTYAHYGVELKPKWFPVFHYLSREEQDSSIMAMARVIGQSHPSIVKIVEEMRKAGLIREIKHQEDGRKTCMELTHAGWELNQKMKPQCQDVARAVDEMLQQSQHKLWPALGEFEYLLKQKSLFDRTMEQKKERLSLDIQIVPFEAKYKDAFRELNEEWIQKFFEMEEIDRQVLENPDSYILDKGGKIFVALLDGEPVGVCAMIKLEEGPYAYELSKMAVSPRAQGKGAGFKLGQAIIEEAQRLGSPNLYLESNTKLGPAISLYEKLGFRKVAARDSSYERCNIQMELDLS